MQFDPDKRAKRGRSVAVTAVGGRPGRQATHIRRPKKPAVAYFAQRHSAFPSTVITLSTRLFVLPAEHSDNLTCLLHISRHVTMLSVTFRDSYSRTGTNTNKQYLWNTTNGTAIGLFPCGSGYFTCKQNMKLVTTRFKSGGLHEKHVVATWNVGNRLSICL